MIGYYVHHHGAGHLSRALAIAGSSTDQFTLLGTGLTGRTRQFPFLDLADDRPVGEDGFSGRDGAADRPAALHYAPLAHDGVRRRVATLANWVHLHAPQLMIVDVSVEVAMLARLAATPTLYVRLAGERTDVAHIEAFRGATALMAPFHPDMDHHTTPEWVRRKTRYFAGLGQTPPAVRVDESSVVVVFGGGGEADGPSLAAAARLTPELNWRVLGPMSPVADPPPNLDWLGWVEDAEMEVARAGVVMGSAGDGIVGAVLAADRPFICLPQARPYGEQTAKADALGVLGAAVVLTDWPAAEAWPELLRRARLSVGDARTRLSRGDGASEARAWILSLASNRQATSGDAE
jgi:hypothetical protein